MDETQPKPSVGLGTKLALGGIITTVAAAAVAVVDAGADFYKDEGVISLIITAAVTILGTFAGRSSQANTLVKNSVAQYQATVARANQVIEAYQKYMEAQGIPTPPVDGGGGGVVVNPPTEPGVPVTPPDQGGPATPGPVG